MYSFLSLLAQIIYERIRDPRKCQNGFQRDLNYWDKNHMWLVADRFCLFPCGQFLRSSYQKTDDLNLQKSAHHIPSPQTPPIFANYICSTWADLSILCHEPPSYTERVLSLCRVKLPRRREKLESSPHIAAPQLINQILGESCLILVLSLFLCKIGRQC